MNERERVRLLHGPYRAPALRTGDRATCLVRDCDVVVTGWSDARIPWPRCRRIGAPGHAGLLVDEELARAVMHESAVAIMHWWGVGVEAVWRWRRALDVKTRNNEGSRRLIRAHCKAAEKLRRERALEMNRIAHARARPAIRPWRTAELRQLGKLPDELLARRIGRSATAVRVMRTRLGIASFHDRRRIHAR